MKRTLAVLFVSTVLMTSNVWACYYSSMMMPTNTDVNSKDAGRMVGDNSTSTTRTQTKANARRHTGGKKGKNKSGVGINNLRLDAGFNYTEFSDRLINVQGDVEDFNLVLSGDINEKLSFTIGYNYNRLDTNEGPEIVIESEGINGSLHYAITENYGVGILGSYNWVDYENVSGNSFAWLVGGFFTTNHDLDYFVLSTVTTVAHTDYDFDHDTFWQVMVDVSRQWNDYFNTFIYAAYTDSFRTNGRTSADNSYFNFGIGFDVYATDNLTFSFAYDSTESFEKYNDQTFSFNVGYTF